MRKIRDTLLVLSAATVSFCISAALAYLWLWHSAGLDSLKPGEEGAAGMGAFAVVIQALAVGGVCAAIVFLAHLILRRRSKQRSI